MKHSLYSCDSCTKMHPEKGIGQSGWWGATAPSERTPVPQYKFGPITRHNRDEFSRHFCSIECLQAALNAYAGMVDMAKVATAKAPVNSIMSMNSLMGSFFGAPPDDSGVSDSTGYYGKKKTEDEDEDNQ